MVEAKIEIILSNGSKAGDTLKELTKNANRLNKEIKDLKPGTEAFAAKAKDLQMVSSEIGKIKEEIKGTAAASDDLKNAFSQFVPFSGTFGQLGQSLGAAKSGVGGLISSFGALKAAIISTGVGALVVALAGLVTWMQKTDEGGDFLEDRMGDLGAQFEVLTSRLNNIGKSFSDFFSNPIKFFKELTIDIGKAVLESRRYIETLRELEDAQHALDIRAADTEKIVGQLLLQSKNISLSYDERIKKIDEANEAEKKLYEDQQVQRQKALDNEQKNLAQRVKDQNTAANLIGKSEEDIIAMVMDGSLKKGAINDEEIERYKNAYIAKVKGETDFITFQEKLQNRRDALTEKQEAERAKAAAAEEKRREEIRKAEEQRLKDEETAMRNMEDLRIALMEEGVNKQIEKITLDTERKIEALVGSEAQITEQAVLLEELKQQQIQAVIDKAAADKKTKDEKEKADQLKRDEQTANEQKRIAEEKVRFEAELEDVRMSTAQSVFAFFGELGTKYAKDADKAKKIQKGFALIDLGINLQKELSANAVAAAANPLNAVTFGAAGAAQLAATNTAALIRTAIGVARVIAFEKGGFLGGLLRGPKHSDGGIPGVIRSTGQPIEMEGDEFIMSGKAVRGIGVSKLMQVNNHYNRKFATGGPLSIATASPSTISSQGLEVTDRLEKMLMQNFEAINSRIDRIKVFNVVTETEEGIKTVNQISADADV